MAAALSIDMRASTTLISYAVIGSASAPVQKLAGSGVAVLFAIACVIAFGVGATSRR